MGVMEQQVRGMKVRSSVKKLCEGCKVCLIFLSIGVWMERGSEGMGRNGRLGEDEADGLIEC
jgi:hypothetical protein